MCVFIKPAKLMAEVRVDIMSALRVWSTQVVCCGLPDAALIARRTLRHAVTCVDGGITTVVPHFVLAWRVERTLVASKETNFLPSVRILWRRLVRRRVHPAARRRAGATRRTQTHVVFRRFARRGLRIVRALSRAVLAQVRPT